MWRADRSYLVVHLSKLPYFAWKAWLLKDWLRINLDFLISLPRVTSRRQMQLVSSSVHPQLPQPHSLSSSHHCEKHTEGGGFPALVWPDWSISYASLPSKKHQTKEKESKSGDPPGVPFVFGDTRMPSPSTWTGLVD